MSASFATPVDCWTFSLIDEPPGSSVGDAAEYLEHLGFNPWKLDKLELVYEFTRGRIVTAVFLVAGPPQILEELRAAHEKALSLNPVCTAR